jgi:hypothetical protein
MTTNGAMYTGGVMKNFGRTSLSEFLGDWVVYRNLVPADPSLPALDALRGELDLPTGQIPRKSEAAYARVIVHLLQAAQKLRDRAEPIRRLLFVGDTLLLDGTAFANICQAGAWPGLAFIGSENAKPASIQVAPNNSGQMLYQANRWAALADFDRYAVDYGFPVDASTAVIVDIDKTALGARGRNGQVIDAARVQAVQDTVAGLLTDHFDPQAFRSAYDLLNQPEFHSFTADNQDYLAYICLILNSGLYQLEQMVTEVRSAQLASFEQLIARVEEHRLDLPPDLRAIHADIYDRVRQGDPTPFKSFRRNEYQTTIRCFGSLPDDAPLEALLAQEILVTQEVRQAALDWRSRGALLFGLSDKPDEAAVPIPDLATRGYLPIHRAETHAVGAVK